MYMSKCVPSHRRPFQKVAVNYAAFMLAICTIIPLCCCDVWQALDTQHHEWHRFVNDCAPMDRICIQAVLCMELK